MWMVVAPGRGGAHRGFFLHPLQTACAAYFALFQLRHVRGEFIPSVAGFVNCAVLVNVDVLLRFFVFLAELLLPRGRFGAFRIQRRAAADAVGQGSTVPLTALGTLHGGNSFLCQNFEGLEINWVVLVVVVNDEPSRWKGSSPCPRGSSPSPLPAPPCPRS